MTLQECLAISDVVVSAVPTASYKVKTEWLKDGAICLNVAADKNFEKEVRDKVCRESSTPLCHSLGCAEADVSCPASQASVYMPTIGKVTIMMLLRNLCVADPGCA